LAQPLPVNIQAIQKGCESGAKMYSAVAFEWGALLEKLINTTLPNSAERKRGFSIIAKVEDDLKDKLFEQQKIELKGYENDHWIKFFHAAIEYSLSLSFTALIANPGKTEIYYRRTAETECTAKLLTAFR